ncbi:hypothetical protein APED_27490 [Acanthopleuribacter pedis]
MRFSVPVHPVQPLVPLSLWAYDGLHYDGDDPSCNLDGGSPSVLVGLSRFTDSIFTVRNSRYVRQAGTGSLNLLVEHSAIPRRVDRFGLGNSSKMDRRRRPYPGSGPACRGAA